MRVTGPREQATAAAQADSDGTYCSHAWNPFFIEGIKTLAFQWWEERGGVMPPSVYVPAGQGSLVLGLYRGFVELHQAFPSFEMPALFAVQHRSSAPLWTARHGEAPDLEPDDIPSLADGIAISEPVRQRSLLDALSATGGDVVTVGNGEIAAASLRLASQGLWVEPTAAAGLAGHAAAEGDADAVVVLTGHGTKAS